MENLRSRWLTHASERPPEAHVSRNSYFSANFDAASLAANCPKFGGSEQSEDARKIGGLRAKLQ